MFSDRATEAAKVYTILTIGNGLEFFDFTIYVDADEAHMRKVVGYVHRHLAQRPSGDVRDTAWRHSLMNWGHDPLKR